MRVFYVRYHDDDPDEDGIWLSNPTEGTQFFVSEFEAIQECNRRNEQRRKVWSNSVAAKEALWEETEIAYGLLEREGLDAKKVFPYHHRNPTRPEFRLIFVVDSIDVKDPDSELNRFASCGCRTGCKSTECEK